MDSPTTAATHDINVYYVIGGKGAYATPRFDLYRASFTTDGSTDNKNITNGVITLRKN